MPLVSNAGPILSFVRAGHLPLLRAVTGSLRIPDAVYAEIMADSPGKPGIDAARHGAWLIRTSVQDRSIVDQLPPQLHLGEREAIALAKELDAALLIDDRAARREAHRLGLDYFGSLRILKEAKDRGIIPAAQPVLDDLMAAGMYLSETLYQAFLQTLGEGSEDASE